MAITTTPRAYTEPPDPDEERAKRATHAPAPDPLATPPAIPDVPGNVEGVSSPQEESGHAPEWPNPGWALQPDRANVRPQRTKAAGLGSTAAIVLTSLVVLSGLFAWFAYDNVASETSHAWANVPQGQPYYESMVKPDVPASAASEKLPPMVTSTASSVITLKVDAPPLGGMYGSTGQVQDAFSPAYFAVPTGTAIQVTVLNYDAAWHTFTAPALGLNVWIRPGGTHPSETTFSFSAPTTGYFEWLCLLPCDPWSMQAPGYMEGEIHAVKA